MSDILNDSRFAKYLNDPRYRQIPKHERKVKLDKRFKSMFEDEKFKVKYTVDKRGRPVNETSTENLRKYYDLDESDSNDSDVDSGENSEQKQVDEESGPGRFVRRPQNDDKDIKPINFQNDELVRGNLDKKTKNKLLDLDIDYARGEGILQTDSSSEEESSDLEEESELEHEWGELDADAETTEESTKRIAICNMDWDNIKAIDLMVLLNSFLSPGGFIHKVTVYPSDYGLKRMQEEEVRGPIELTENKEGDLLDDDGGNEEGSTYHMEKLRRYQLNRLKYYYAVVECNSVATADKLYRECDGIEYESSATRLDMRFIPDDVTFDQEPREVCTKMPDMTKYKSRLFTTTALQQAKVELTWDVTNPNRTEVIKSALDGKIDDLELKDYLASSSDSEDDNQNSKLVNDATHDENDTDDPIMKYKMLLNDIEKKEENKKNKDMEMEITWGLGIKEKAEELVKKKINEENKELTPFERLLKKRQEKRKEKKLQRKEKSEKEDSNSDEGQSDDDVPSDVDMNDPYFAEEFNKPEFKKVNSEGKNKKSSQEINSEEEKKKAELELLLDDDDDGKAHFSLKKIQKAEDNTSRKKKIKQKIKEKQTLPDFDIDVNDVRFSALYDSHLFNIDPSDSNFKKTRNMEKLIQEKLKRRPVESNGEEQIQPKVSKKDAELSVLLKNIKRKTKHVMKK